MKKIFLIIFLIFLPIFALLIINAKDNADQSLPNDEAIVNEEESQTGMPNPASTYCNKNGGELEIITNKDGSQFGLCKFEDYSCEEWAYMNGECAIDKDSEKIKEALEAKGLNLSGMKVVIHKHLGKYISGGVVPVDMLGGGGYVFAVKDENGNVDIVADGNGAIMCEMLEDYPDFPAYLISECVDEGGNPVKR